MSGSQGLADPAEGEQSGVGIHAFGEPAQQNREKLPLQRRPPADPARQCFNVPHGSLRIQVTQGSEPALGCLRAEFGVLAAQLGRSVEQRPVEDALVQLPHGFLGLLPCRHQLVRMWPLQRKGPRTALARNRWASSVTGMRWVRRSWKSWIRCSSSRR